MKNILKKIVCAALIFNPLSMKSAAMENLASGIKDVIATNEAIQTLATVNAVACSAYATHKILQACRKKILKKDSLDLDKARGYWDAKIDKQNQPASNWEKPFFKGWLLCGITATCINIAEKAVYDDGSYKLSALSASVIIPQVATYAIIKLTTKSIGYFRNKARRNELEKFNSHGPTSAANIATGNSLHTKLQNLTLLENTPSLERYMCMSFGSLLMGVLLQLTSKK